MGKVHGSSSRDKWTLSKSMFQQAPEVAYVAQPLPRERQLSLAESASCGSRSIRVGDRIDPSDLGKASEVGVGGTDINSVFHRQRRQVRI